MSALSGLSEDLSVVGLLRVKEQQVPIATKTVHRQQYHNRDSSLPILKLIRQRVRERSAEPTHLLNQNPIWPVRKASAEWRLTVDYCGLNEVTSPLSAAVPDMLELQ